MVCITNLFNLLYIYNLTTMNSEEANFTHEQSLKVIFDMIEVSKNKLRYDGILFIVWGWMFFIVGTIQFLQQNLTTTYQIRSIAHVFKMILPLLALLFTLGYIFKHRKRVQTYIGKILRVTWIAMFLSLVLINLIQFNVLGKITFELQHPIFMVVIAFAIVITGSILKYYLLIVGGIVFGLLAFISSYFKLETQLTLETLGWLIAFVIPGHYMFAQRKNNLNV